LTIIFNSSNPLNETLEIKSILVRTGPDQFREIFITEPATTGAVIQPMAIVNAGRQHILLSTYDAAAIAAE